MCTMPAEHTPTAASEHIAPDGTPLVPHTLWVADRGERPVVRGWFHMAAAFLAVISGSVLTTYAWLRLDWLPALGVTVYAVGFFLLFGVSAAYHRGPWRRASTITWWRRADHSTIAVFIAATYTPLCLLALPRLLGLAMLLIAWVGAAAGVLLSMVWINHPRWLDVVVYIALGWLIVPLLPQLWGGVGPAVVWLLFVGGVVYSGGAVIYGLQWPGREARRYGYHEHFHTATILAAVVHLVAVWMVVVDAGSAGA